jgi:hypothetical protein
MFQAYAVAPIGRFRFCIHFLPLWLHRNFDPLALKHLSYYPGCLLKVYALGEEIVYPFGGKG